MPERNHRSRAARRLRVSCISTLRSRTMRAALQSVPRAEHVTSRGSPPSRRNPRQSSDPASSPGASARLRSPGSTDRVGPGAHSLALRRVRHAAQPALREARPIGRDARVQSASRCSTYALVNMQLVRLNSFNITVRVRTAGSQANK